MSAYAAPLKDMRFALQSLADLPGVAELPGFESASPDLVDAILEEAGKLASGVIAPLNVVGDRQGSVLENGVVRTPEGWREAYTRFTEGGWQGLPFPEEYGGQGLPWVLATAVMEIWQAANLSFGLAPLLNQGAVDALLAHGSEEQKALYVPKMISGEWAGTMNLTEPQAGSDLSQVRTRAVPHGDGTYRITGLKIFITYGEHDLTDNIVHLVLARLPDAPPGTKGISLFVVPKFLLNPDGSLGARNDLRCVSLEHKLGIHASPTCVMAYGDSGGAVGYMVGEPNRGLEYMFTMMNNARLSVGLQGVAIAERAYQHALDYARQRVQGRDLDGRPATIIRHPDVRRMLLTMKAKTEAARALTYFTMAQIDRAHHATDPQERARAKALADLLTPVVKAWSTEIGCEAADIGVQIHGGMGFIEETGAAQYYRDARITPIYEGTTGIQALDLVGRKVQRDNGAAAEIFFGLVDETLGRLSEAPGNDAELMGEALADAVEHLRATTRTLLGEGRDPAFSGAVSVPYLRLFGITAGGWMMAKSLLTAIEASHQPGADRAFFQAKLATARFYAEQVLPFAAANAAAVRHGGATVMALPEDLF